MQEVYKHMAGSDATSPAVITPLAGGGEEGGGRSLLLTELPGKQQHNCQEEETKSNDMSFYSDDSKAIRQKNINEIK